MQDLELTPAAGVADSGNADAVDEAPTPPSASPAVLMGCVAAALIMCMAGTCAIIVFKRHRRRGANAKASNVRAHCLSCKNTTQTRTVGA